MLQQHGRRSRTLLWHLARRIAVPYPSHTVASGSTARPGALPFSTAAAAQQQPAPVGLKKVLVANRSEIACRVLTTARRLGVPTVAVFSEADRSSTFVRLADEAFCIGPPAARESYLRSDNILAVARSAGADAVHPGYGFLSENAAFAEACAAAGVRFVGPPADAIRAMGDKARAKEIMSAAGVPVVPGYHGTDQDEARLAQEADAVGFPLLVKAVSGGGGKGMKLANSKAEFADALASAKREASASFGDDRVLLERYIKRPRHVEVQIMADSHGNAVYLFDRDCSVQRRHQKIIEEAPAPGLPDDFHRHIGEAAVRAAKAVGYVSAGTVEFIVDVDTSEFFFMEMNTRLQVEHPVTEAVANMDLVELQLRVAAGEQLPVAQEQLVCRGHAFEARLYAESPSRGFLPGAGVVRRWRTPPTAGAFTHTADVRVDSGVVEGDAVGTHYDPMIAKIVARGADRDSALAALRIALAQTQVAGLPTNLAFLQRLAAHPAFIGLELDTGFIARHGQQLLQPEQTPQHVTALAVVARSMLQAAAAARAHRISPGMGAWAIPDAKRLWHHCEKVLPLHIGGDREEGEAEQQVALTYKGLGEYEVRLAQGASPVRVAGATLSTAGDAISAEVDGQLLRADVLQYPHANEQVLTLWHGGRAHEFRWQVPQWSKDAEAVGTASGAVVTPMPGKVVKVLVADGQVVTKGQPLLVLEAMKMEHSVTAPRDGMVAGLQLRVGSRVEDGQVLLQVAVQQGVAGEASACGAAKAATVEDNTAAAAV